MSNTRVFGAPSTYALGVLLALSALSTFHAFAFCTRENIRQQPQLSRI
jgi:hypothetical protein